MTFSFDDAQDAAYALGWPHVRRIEHGASPARIEEGVTAAREILREVDPPWFASRSEAMCLAYVRGVSVTPQADPPEAATQMARGGPLDDAELELLLDRWLVRGLYWFQIEELVLSLEALLGSDAAGAKIAARIGRMRLARGPDLGSFFGNARTEARQAALFCLGFVALRSEPTRTALEQLRREASGPPREVLDLVLGGADACRRHGVRHLFAASFAGDDPGYLAELSATERFDSSLTPRFPYLGGEAVLAHYVARARHRIPPYAAVRFVEQFGTIRHPLTIELMGVLATRKTPREHALAWLREHADYVDEIPGARRALPDAVRALLDEPQS